MYLKSLEINGFKSFARKMRLDFTSAITGVVGPNGSGKSNVAESFRFVLGEQSMKSMRGKRTEDLIFNGSGSSGRLNRASVKLTFDNLPQTQQGNVKRLFDIDFDEVVLERVIYRDASSEYFINGSPARLKDIFELLAHAHIGASGHHIISQGEADRVLSVNSRERKTMIEDALGLKVYQYKKEESERKLEKAGENLERVNGLRNELKPHLAFLKKQVAKIEKAKELADELKITYRSYFHHEKIYLDQEQKAIQALRNPLLAEQQELEKQIATARETLARLETAHTQSGEILILEESLRTTRQAKDSVARERGQCEGELRVLERHYTEQKEKRQNEQGSPVPYGNVVGLTRRVLASFEDLLQATTLEQVQTIAREVKEYVTGFNQRLESEHVGGTDQTLEQIEKEIQVLQERHTDFVRQQGKHESAEQELLTRYQQLQQTIESDRSSGRDAERAVFALTTKQNDIRLELQKLEGREQARVLLQEEYDREFEEARTLVGERELMHDTALPSESIPTRSEQEERKRVLQRMKIRLEDSGAVGADDVMKEYTQATERDQFLEREVLDLEQSIASLHALIGDLEATLAQAFADGLMKINKQFNEFFGIMFGGGSASLELKREIKRKRKDAGIELGEEGDTDENEESFEGVEITVSLPHKKIRSLEMLSGGERALTSIALIFAMSQVNPPPFIILDETDAALDEANSRRYGDMIENLAKHSQLILITHNRETMSRAGVLYGVTMGSDAVSQLLSVSFTEAVQVAK